MFVLYWYNGHIQSIEVFIFNSVSIDSKEYSDY